jgi:hypothetical protein
LAADAVLSHRNECSFEVLTCNFAGICKDTYMRGDGRDAHDGESLQAHLNLAMSLIDKQARTIEQQARTIEQQTERMNELASTKLYLKGTVSAVTPLTSLKSDSIRFGGNQVHLDVSKATDGTLWVYLNHHGSIASPPTYRQIDVFFKKKKVMSLTDVNLPQKAS